MSMIRYGTLLGLALATVAQAADVSILHVPVDEATDREFPLAAKAARTEAELDRLEALAHFAAARNAADREDDRAALRQYERAYRLAPQNSPALSPILSLAMKSKREELALEYLIDNTVREGTDVDLLTRLSKSLLELGEEKRALRTFRQAFAADAKEKPTARRVQIASQLATLCYKYDDPQGSIAALQTVIDALNDPAKFGLDDETQAKVKNAAAATWELFGYAQLDCEHAEAAAEAFTRAEKIESNPALLEFRLAKVDEHSGQTAQALAHLEKYFASHDTGAGEDAPKLLRKLLAKLGRAESYLPRLKELSKQDSENVYLRLALADELLESKQFAPAAEVLQAVQTPSGAKKLRWLTLLADAQLGAERWGVAFQTLGELAQLGSISEVWPAADSIAASPAWLAPALSFATKHFAGDSWTIPERRAAGEIAALAGNVELARILLEKEFVATHSSPEVCILWGRALMTAKKYDAASDVFAKGDDRKFGPRAELCHRYRMAALDLAGKVDDAVKLASETTGEGEPPLPARMLIAGTMLHHVGRDAEAKKILTDLDLDEKLATDDTAEIPRQARLTLSLIASTAADLPAAEEYLQRVLDEFPADVGALNDLGYLWADQGKHLQRALEMIRRAVEDEPESMAYRDSLGWVYFKLGDLTKAQVELSKAVHAEEADGEIWDHLGEVYFAQADFLAARDAWQHAKSSYEKRPTAAGAGHIQAKLDRVQKMPPTSDKQND
jgi:Tfp pilus assembly protein PilF